MISERLAPGLLGRKSGVFHADPSVVGAGDGLGKLRQARADATVHRRGGIFAAAVRGSRGEEVVEGEAHAANRATTEAVADHFYNKYEWDFRYDESMDWRLVEVTPHKILAWGDEFDGDGIRVI